ncbi:MAG: glycosyl hydrolase 115 family protein [Kiritimatiellae bacterium]|nr:glycosyl hydrolase 115 family protein [Kiritimatiellia bacterium]
MMRFEKEVTFCCDCDEIAVEMAVNDLIRDLWEVAGCDVSIVDDSALIKVSCGTIDGNEQYAVFVNADGVSISGSDVLGTIYGVYKFSEVCLGVDPLWFWKDNYPALNDSLDINDVELFSNPSTFKYRGWFINDEDLLTEWLPGSGPRYIRYPYYSNVISLDIADAIYEAALRCETNMIIPASFVDIMNPFEAKLIEMAVERGLYVTQHHIEPLGVSHFGFENYWNAKGKEYAFSYGSEPEKVIEVWTEYAKKWYEIAGEQVIWQTGLRGKGDRSIWHSDPSVAADQAGRMISKAVNEQLEIIHSIDERKNPPSTFTAWLEMTPLLMDGTLEVPEECIMVFCDQGCSQRMLSDFYDMPRGENCGYGVYFHIAFYLNGPHCLPGVSPAKLDRVYRSVLEKGDSDYSIVNVANIREHVLPIAANAKMTRDVTTWNYDKFMRDFCGEFQYDYESYFSALTETPHGVFQDGDALVMLLSPLYKHVHGVEHFKKYKMTYAGSPVELERRGIDTPQKRRKFEQTLFAKIEMLEAIYENIPDDAPLFYQINLGEYSRQLAFLYELSIVALRVVDELEPLTALIPMIDKYVDMQKTCEYGKWENWYRGDKKLDWLEKREEIFEILKLYKEGAKDFSPVRIDLKMKIEKGK